MKTASNTHRYEFVLNRPVDAIDVCGMVQFKVEIVDGFRQLDLDSAAETVVYTIRENGGGPAFGTVEVEEYRDCTLICGDHSFVGRHPRTGWAGVMSWNCGLDHPENGQSKTFAYRGVAVCRSEEGLGGMCFWSKTQDQLPMPDK